VWSWGGKELSDLGVFVDVGAYWGSGVVGNATVIVDED
jgi:hypothetical protein